jgi:alpha-N-arabinofuranosidase
MAAPGIPEFVLRKLIIPNSYQTTQKSITFAIRNTFAPGTLLNIEIEVDDANIPNQKIILTSKGRPPIKASEITPANPFTLSMGLTVTIEIQNITSGKKIKFSTLTKEIGEIRFTFRPSRKKTRQKQKQQFRQHKFFSPAIKAMAEIRPENEIGNISPYIYGQFIEHLEDCIYGGIWTKDGTNLRPDTLALIKQLQPSIVRYPGGNFASGYHWEDGIGPVEKRPERFDTAWQAPEKNFVGTDEFIRFCREIRSDPFLVVNDGSGTPEEAARWVEYCNGSATMPQGLRRKQNSSPDPHNVRIWGVGNEVWGAWQIGTTSAKAYTDRLLKFISRMKKVDPTIKIVAVGDGIQTDAPNDKGFLWNSEVIQQAGSQIDYLSWHIYQPDQSAWLDHYDLEKLHWSVCAAPLDVENIIHRIDRQIKQLSPKKSILQALDEWNLWLTPPADAVSMHKLIYTMRDALYCAGMLNVFIRNCRSLGMANLAQLVNVLPLIITTNDQAYPTPMYFPFLMYKKMQPIALSTTNRCDEFKSEALGVNINTHNHVPYLDLSATRDQTGNVISIALINRHHSRKIDLGLTFKGSTEYSPYSSTVLKSKNPLDFNSAEKPDCVKSEESELPISDQGILKGSLPACSVTVWEFKKR